MNGADGKFAPPGPSDVARLLKEFPLAWLVATAAEGFHASPLPLRPRFDADGRLLELDGHMSRANPLVGAFRAHPRGLAMFMGPQGYISPSWMTDRTQAPTWNYVAAHFTVDITFIGTDAGLDPLLDDIVDAMESHRAHAWSTAEMGPRYRKLADRVIGFHAAVRSGRIKFKMGQDEREDVYGDIVHGLGDEGSTELLEWMRRCNPGRHSE
ncbi:MAG: Protease synthase and sporulation protein PAI 2 [Steroidobacteraceae bacterium]|nr:Protease synthase and sporulation protein PAI 2 [Steroidobacteraceae bacterium]